jgi:hypothetical protein
MRDVPLWPPQREVCPLAELGLDADMAAMSLENLLAGPQAHAVPFDTFGGDAELKKIFAEGVVDA